MMFQLKRDYLVTFLMLFSFEVNNTGNRDKVYGRHRHYREDRGREEGRRREEERG